MPFNISFQSTKLYNASTTAVQVINTVTETDLFNFTVDPGAVGVGDMIRIRAYGNQFNNKGSAGVSRLKFYLSGTALADTGASAPSIPDVATVRGACAFEFVVAVKSSTAADLGGFMIFGTQSTTMGASIYTAPLYSESATIVLGSGIGCRLSVTLGAASPNYDQRLLSYTTEILKTT